MKFTHLLFILSTFLFEVSAQNVFILGQPITVANGADYGAIRPRVALSGNTPLVMMGKTATPKELNVARWNGSGFNTPVNVLPGPIDILIHPFDAPSFATNGQDVFVTYFNLPHSNSDVFTVKSSDGGVTWNNAVQVTNIGDSIPALVDVDILGNGNPLVSWIQTTSNWHFPKQVVARSNDGGSSYLPPIDATALTAGEPCECCASTVIADGNTVALLFRNNDNNARDAFASISTDGGASFPDLVQVDFSGWIVPACPSSGPVGFISEGNLNAAWMTEGEGQASIKFGRLDLQSLQAGGNIDVDATAPLGATQDQPQIAGRGDTIGVVWEDTRNGTKDIYFAYTTTGPTGFNPSINITDSTNTLGSQVSPDVAYNHGVFHLVYHDQSNNRVVYRTIALSTTVGVATVKPMDLSALIVSPIPVADFVQVKWNSRFAVKTISIIAMNGKVMMVFHPEGGTAFMKADVADLADGKYLVVVKDNANQETVTRFVKAF